VTTAAEAGRLNRTVGDRRAWGAVTAVLAAACVVKFGPTPGAVLAAGFVAVLAAVCASDLERRIIPNRIVLPATAVALAVQVALEPDRALEWIIGGVAAAVILALPLVVAPGGVGMGDLKLALLLGVVLGRYVWVALVVAFLAAFAVALVLLIRHGAAARSRAFAFGPFLAFGAVVALFAGDRVASMYLG
jgi:leader peptidase (prepilin peptidase)/N-methyltransferase